MRRLLPLSFLILCCIACTHPYLEQKRSQQRYARSLRPAQLQRVRPNSQALRSLKLRVYADPDYRAQNQGWRGTLNELVGNANQMLGGVFAAELKVETAQEWNRVCTLADLDACLAELVVLDAGEADVWVLGLVGSMPQLTRKFDDLGRAEVPGRHMILRGMSDLDERDGVEQLDRISPADRRAIVRQRREHKGTVVLLHEWAHTLGAHHEQEPGWILHASYDQDQSEYPPASIAIMRGMLEAQLAKLPLAEQQERYRTLIEQHAGGWEPKDRALALASVTPRSGPPAVSSQDARSSAVIAGEGDPALAALSDSDRAQYAQAVRHANQHNLSEGLPIALALAQRYSEVYPVQHLACGMVMERGGDMQWIESICQPALDLARQRAP